MAYLPAQIEEHKETVLELMSLGGSLNKISKRKDLPSKETIQGWLNKDADFFANYVRAKESWFMLECFEIFDIADNMDITSRETIQRDTKRMEIRQWALSKLMPKYKNKDTTNNTIIIPTVGKMEISDTFTIDVTEEADKLE